MTPITDSIKKYLGEVKLPEPIFKISISYYRNTRLDCSGPKLEPSGQAKNDGSIYDIAIGKAQVSMKNGEFYIDVKKTMDQLVYEVARNIRQAWVRSLSTLKNPEQSKIFRKMRTSRFVDNTEEIWVERLLTIWTLLNDKAHKIETDPILRKQLHDIVVGFVDKNIDDRYVR